MAATRTYNCKQVMVALGEHNVTGFADDSFIQIEPLGDGITSKSGCDSEVARAIDPNMQYTVKLTLLQTSVTNQYLQQKFNQDQTSGDGLFAITITDLMGNFEFSSESCWVTKPASRQFGKDTNNREWELTTGAATMSEGTY